MKSRHLAAMEHLHQRRHWRIFWIFALILVGVASAAFAQQEEIDPPGRVGLLTYRQGGVVFAPQGEEEWTELPQNRPITAGDRVWTDRGARAEMQIGAATLHLDGESHLGVSDLDDKRAQFILQQGSVNLRVRELVQGENVEIDTPNIALRALQPGDYRVDVDASTGQTRVTVQSGTASVFGEGGESINMGAGQQVNFAGRFLAQVDGPQYRQDDFGLWAAERNRVEDQSIAARHVPRGVVGATQLDPYGTWGQDANYGAVWYPTVTVTNWAPYRYGHWDWVAPWGWTWVDDAPWGFAPFHYGRWTMIGTRWAWVPGRMAVRPVYSPALVVFLGGGGTRVSFSSGPAVGWYPLAPGEAWWPVYRTSPRYVNFANFNINLNAYPRQYANHFWRSRTVGITAVGEGDFRSGRPVFRHWQPLPQHAIGGAQMNVVPVRPDRHHGDGHGAPRLFASPPAAVQPAQQVVPQQRPFGMHREAPQGMRDQLRAFHEQERLQRDAERAARDQQRAAELARQQQDHRGQREQLFRQQQEQAARAQAQREAVQRQQQDQAARVQAQREAIQRAQHEQATRVEQERAQREAWRQQRDAARQAQQPAPAVQHVRPFMQQQVQVPQQQVQAVQQLGGPGRGHGGEHRGRGGEEPGQQGGGQGQGHGRWNR